MSNAHPLLLAYTESLSRAGERGHVASEDEEYVLSEEIIDDINTKLTRRQNIRRLLERA